MWKIYHKKKSIYITSKCNFGKQQSCADLDAKCCFCRISIAAIFLQMRKSSIECHGQMNGIQIVSVNQIRKLWWSFDSLKYWLKFIAKWHFQYENKVVRVGYRDQMNPHHFRYLTSAIVCDAFKMFLVKPLVQIHFNVNWQSFFLI